MDAVIVLAPHLGGGWSYYRAFKPMVLTEDQCTYIKAMGASVDCGEATVWIRSNDPRPIAEYLDRLPKDDKPLGELMDELEDAIGTGDIETLMERVALLRRRLRVDDAGREGSE